jgi:hypothetical protein
MDPFVRDSKGDSVASALSVEDHKITIRLAANRGRPSGCGHTERKQIDFDIDHDPKTAKKLLFDSAKSITYSATSLRSGRNPFRRRIWLRKLRRRF